jgi:hypothetical protein
VTAEQFRFAADFARHRKLVVGFEVNGERFDMVVPRDGRCIPYVLAVELEDIMDFFRVAMTKESLERFEDLVYDFDEGLEMAQITMLFHHSLSLLCGEKPYWVVQTLVATAREMWDQLSGEKAGAVRPMDLPLHEFVSMVYAWLVGDATGESREKFDAMLNRPPAGVEKEIMAATPEWASAGDQFMAQMAARGGR